MVSPSRKISGAPTPTGRTASLDVCHFAHIHISGSVRVGVSGTLPFGDKVRGLRIHT